MDNYLEKLNRKQYEAVTTDSQYVRIVAGAGSGKTRVLTTRIVYLIENWGIDPESILAITFTNKAANEMKVRIEKMLGGSSQGCHISTIHSFAVTFLRQEIRREGYPSNFTILDQDDQKSILKEAYKEFDFSTKEYPFAKVLDFIANNKTAGISPESSIEMAYSAMYENMGRIYQFYQDRCQQLYGLDFDDLLLWTNKILKKYPKVRQKWQEKYQFILVDEFQDIDRVQDELINLLTSASTYLYVVGDPDQTIYTWRGADINIIMGFDQRYENAKTIVLEKNYRSTGNILNGANSLIQYNKNRIKKDLYTDNEDGTKIIHFTAGDQDSEAGYVLMRINELLRQGCSFRSIAVLYRSSYLSRPVEKKLVDFKIPYVIYGGIRFFERAEIKDVLSYLRLIVNGDDLAYKRVINQPKRSIGEKSLDSLFQVARRKNVSLMQAVEDFDGPPKTREKLLQFNAMIEDWRQRYGSQSLEDTFQMVFEESGYRKMLENSDDVKDEERLENVKELLNDIIAYQGNHLEASLEDYLANVALYTDIQDNSNGDYLSLMTIHAAKGLEFDNVFVIGLSEGVFPSERTVQENGNRGVEEERRLAYVAYTRARKRLYLTDNCGYSYTTSTSMSTSRFVKEIDEKYIISNGVDAKLKSSAGVSATVTSMPSSPAASQGKKNKYRPGDQVVHEIFGDGVVISVDYQKNTGVIAFPYPHMNKTMKLDFPKMHKKEAD